MDKINIKNNIYKGEPVKCSKEEYTNTVRDDLQTVAGEFIDEGEALRASMALMEVKRLDRRFEYELH